MPNGSSFGQYVRAAASSTTATDGLRSVSKSSNSRPRRSAIPSSPKYAGVTSDPLTNTGCSADAGLPSNTTRSTGWSCDG